LLGTSEGASDGCSLGTPLWFMVGLDDGDTFGSPLGTSLWFIVGLVEGDFEGRLDGIKEGYLLGTSEGLLEGRSLGKLLGLSDGSRLGKSLGDVLGRDVGSVLGCVVGLAEGPILGIALGRADGFVDGLGVTACTRLKQNWQAAGQASRTILKEFHVLQYRSCRTSFSLSHPHFLNVPNLVTKIYVGSSSQHFPQVWGQLLLNSGRRHALFLRSAFSLIF